jgi:UDP-GlcNAc:undecaprenyl-phosphate GlcNAc-1-phosphate transferase
MLADLAALFTSFAVTFLLIPIIIKYSLQKNLVDVPGRRKIHKTQTPSMGGIGVFIGFLVSILIWINLSAWNDIKFVAFALIIAFITGLRDDLVPLRPIYKLIAQIFAGLILVILLDMRLHSFYGLIGGEWPLWISYLITIFTIIVITNSFNLIDGLDGLAGTIATCSLGAFGAWFFLMGDTVFAVLAFSMIGAILGFLYFNWQPAKIFMGDTGSLVIGLFLSICTVRFINLNDSLSDDSALHFEASIATAGSFIIVPLIDTFRIVVLRLLKRQSPFKPDKQHIHHAFLRLGMSHAKTSLSLGGIQLLFILLAIAFMKLGGDRILLPSLLILTATLSIILDRLLINKVS